MSDIENRVKKIVVEHLGIDESKVVETASFIDDLGADSLDTVELVMAFEEEFDCEIPDDAAEKSQHQPEQHGNPETIDQTCNHIPTLVIRTKPVF